MFLCTPGSMVDGRDFQKTGEEIQGILFCEIYHENIFLGSQPAFVSFGRYGICSNRTDTSRTY